MRHFVILLDELVPAKQRDKITSYLRDARCGFWHHIGNSWVVTMEDRSRSAIDLKDKVKEIAPSHLVLVIELHPTDWATYSPVVGHDWLLKYLVPSEGTSLPNPLNSGTQTLGETAAR